jgi:uncharacterized membrane protein YkoI
MTGARTGIRTMIRSATFARFVIAATFAFACAFALAPTRAQETAKVPQKQTASDTSTDAAHPAPAAAALTCLDQKERHAAADSGHLIRLSVAMRAARSKMPGSVVGARLCHGPDGLVYVLTVLAHDGKVRRMTVDATSGVLVGER